MKIVFCGTPEFAVPSLEAVLAAGHEVPLVLTQPNRPAGRKMEMQAPAVKKAAELQGIPVLQPEKIKNNLELRAILEEAQPDAIVVVAYGRIVPKWMLDLPRYGCLNVHGSLLPKYRGAAPIQWAVANGERETGVSIMRLDEGLDTGPVFLEASIPVGPDTLAVELFSKLATVGAGALSEVLQGLRGGTAESFPQDDAQASLAPILTREDGRMLLVERRAQTVYDHWRGFSPWPGAHGVFRGKRFLVHKMQLGIEVKDVVPGALLSHDGRLHAVASDGWTVVLDEVQMEGKARMAGGQFARDFQVRHGEQLA